MSYETLLIEKVDQIAVIKINRPDVLNALNQAVLRDLKNAFIEIENNISDYRGVLLTGEGKAFVAGADIASMKTMKPLDSARFCRLGHDCMRQIENCSVPVLAAVNGFALGGGLELALSCDFIYASQKAKLGLPEVNLGLFPGFGGTQRLARVIGRNRAKELVYTADMIGAEDALRLGLVNRVIDPENLMDEALKTLQKIATKGPVAVSLAKRVINEGTDLPLEAGLALEQTQFPLVFATEDRLEGVTAFLEKRQAKFMGK